ncbi:MAG: isoprenylcysteine carboxylmethyltransferase family protein [Anaerolineales bacterium]|nr:isoprenylcysteine carboxylmethyltransferase family protein [Anaerolineales bacterium]
MWKLVVFVIASIGIVYVSRDSLRVRAHGLYRFFAWELILALFLLNVEFWFDDPFAPHQLIAWTMLIVSAILVIAGVRLLREIGKPDRARQDDGATIAFEKTTILVEVGAYKYIRHPLYSSLLFLAWGIFSKAPSLLGTSLAMLATIFLIATAKVEERENIRFFGPAYQAYIERTKMFVPFLF